MTILDDAEPYVDYLFKKSDPKHQEKSEHSFLFDGTQGNAFDDRYTSLVDEHRRCSGDSRAKGDILSSVFEQLHLKKGVVLGEGLGIFKREIEKINEVVTSLKSKHSAEALPHLEQLLDLIQKYGNSRKCRDALVQDNIAEILSTQIKAVLKDPLTADGWAVLKLTYQVSLELTSNEEDSSMFIAHMIATGFVVTTVDVVNNSSVISAHDKNKVHSESIVFALKTLLNITRRAPILGLKQRLEENLLKYNNSGDKNVVQVAGLLKILISLSQKDDHVLQINIPLHGQLLTSEQLNSHDIATAGFLARNLDCISKKKKVPTATLR